MTPHEMEALLRNIATKDDLRALATKEDLKTYLDEFRGELRTLIEATRSDIRLLAERIAEVLEQRDRNH